MDVLTYLQRINYNGAVTPTLTTLRDIHLAHLYTVPFENLDIHWDNPIVLQRDNLFEKIVRRRRGGFCYELNGLLAWLLQELGFQVTLLSARDAHADGGFGPEFDHLALQVFCPADATLPTVPWLVDVGWGDTFRQPLRLDKPNEAQPEGSRTYRLDQEGIYYLLWQYDSAQTGEKQYRFTLEPRQFSDFEPMCHYHQTSPDSSFTQRRICTLATPNGRITLSNNNFIVTINGQREERTVSQTEYNTILAEQFGIIKQ